MWPDLFGPGWMWGMLSALGLLALFVALVLVSGDPVISGGAAAAAQRIRRGHERNDLTRPEFERARALFAATDADSPSASISSRSSRTTSPEEVPGLTPLPPEAVKSGG